MMRIALITYEFPPRILGGLGIHCAHLVRALVKKVWKLPSSCLL